MTANLSCLDILTQVGSDHNHIHRALKLYIKVLEAVEEHGDSEAFNSLANVRFMRLLHHINTTFRDGRNFWEVFSGPYHKPDPEVLVEIQKAFNGVTEEGLPAMEENRRHPDDVAQSAEEFREQMWNIVPTLHEATIAACLAADFMVTRKQKIRPATTIEVNGRTVQPWKEFAAYFNTFLVI